MLYRICCKSWQSGGYIQPQAQGDLNKDAVSHGKVEGTSNGGATDPRSRSAVSHGKVEGTSNSVLHTDYQWEAVSHGKVEGTSNYRVMAWLLLKL